MNRRDLLQLGGAALASIGVAGRLYAAPTSGPRFLLVFLRGGYDSSNLLIPYSSGYYYEARPSIAIARPEPASSTGALALDANWALAPAVRDTIGAMYLQRQVAFIPFAGTDDLSRSHFETQDSIELGSGCQLGARARRARHHRCDVPAAPGGVHPVRRHGRSVAQPFRNSGQHRARPTLQRSAQLPLRLSRAAVR